MVRFVHDRTTALTTTIILRVVSGRESERDDDDDDPYLLLLNHADRINKAPKEYSQRSQHRVYVSSLEEA